MVVTLKDLDPAASLSLQREGKSDRESDAS